MSKELLKALRVDWHLISQARDILLDDDLPVGVRVKRLDEVLDGHVYREAKEITKEAYKSCQEEM